MTTGQNSDIFQHSLAAIAKAWSFDGQDVEGTTHLVDNQGCQGLTVQILGNDDQLFGTGLQNALQHGKDIGNRADLLIGDKDVGIG